jgi:hypothetical protein
MFFADEICRLLHFRAQHMMVIFTLWCTLHHSVFVGTFRSCYMSSPQSFVFFAPVNRRSIDRRPLLRP